MNCPAAIESLVKVSGWDGHVYLLTDKSSCFNEQEIIRDASMQSDKLHIVQMNEHFDDMNYGFDGKSIDLRRNRKKSFRVKTLLFEHIPDPSITTLAYVDCDILFGQPGCAQRFITAGSPWSNAEESVSKSTTKSSSTSKESITSGSGADKTQITSPSASTSISSDTVVPSLKVTIKFLNEQTGGFEGIHCGTMVMHRRHSAEALRLWREQMDHGTEARTVLRLYGLYSFVMPYYLVLS